MLICYVAGPFRGKNAWEVEKNIRAAEELGFSVAEVGAMPIIPHCNTRFFNGTLTDQFWLDGTMALLRKADVAIFTENWPVSSGARAERAEAERLGIPCFDSVVDLQEHIEKVTREANQDHYAL